MDDGDDNQTTTIGTGGLLTTPTIGNPAKAAIVASLRPALETIYVSSWNSFLSQMEDNERIARLKRLAKEQRLDKKADDVAQLLNAEGNVDPKCLADLIRKEVASQRVSDQQKIKSLEAKVRNNNIGNNNNNNNKSNNKQRNKAKNNERGRGGAARTKKSTTRSPTPPKRRSQSNARHSVD